MDRKMTHTVRAELTEAIRVRWVRVWGLAPPSCTAINERDEEPHSRLHLDRIPLPFKA